MRSLTWLQLHLIHLNLHDFLVTAQQLLTHVRLLLILPGYLLADRLADLAFDFVLIHLQVLVVLALIVIGVVVIIDHVHVLPVFVLVGVEVDPVLLHQVGVLDVCFVEVIFVRIVVMFGVRVIVRVMFIVVFVEFLVFVYDFILLVFI